MVILDNQVSWMSSCQLEIVVAFKSLATILIQAAQTALSRATSEPSNLMTLSAW